MSRALVVGAVLTSCSGQDAHEVTRWYGTYDGQTMGWDVGVFYDAEGTATLYTAAICNEFEQTGPGERCDPTLAYLPDGGGELDVRDVDGWVNADGISTIASLGFIGADDRAWFSFNAYDTAIVPVHGAGESPASWPSSDSFVLPRGDHTALGAYAFPCDVDVDGQADACLGSGNAAIYLGPVGPASRPWAVFRGENEGVIGHWRVGDFGRGSEALLKARDGLIAVPVQPGDHELSAEPRLWEGWGGAAFEDLDGDGDLDVIVHDFSVDEGAGVVTGLIDGPEGLLSREAFLLTGPEASNFGANVVFGDYNGDGRVDMAVGAAGRRDESGRVFVFAGPLETVTSVDEAEVWEANCGGADRYGISLATVSGEGNDQLLVGASQCTVRGVWSGAVFLLGDPLRGR